MIRGKLVETIFRRLWVVAIPIVIVPLFVVVMTEGFPTYESHAKVWVTSPVGDAQPAIGHTNTFMTPAQNQTQALNDLLATQSFRRSVVLDAGIAKQTDSESSIASAASDLKVSATSSGVNLLTVTAQAGSAERAQAIVSGVVDVYLARATSEVQRDASLSAEYYKQQLTVAQKSLDQRRSDLAAYLAANPRAADPTNAASLDINYRTIVQHVDTQQKLVDSLQLQLQGVGLREASAPQSQEASFNVQDPASKPSGPMPVPSTRRFGLPAAAMLFGILIAAGYVYFAYHTDHSIRSSEDLQGLGVPLLGAVPELRPAGPILRYTPIGWFIAWRKRDFARQTAASISPGAPMAAKESAS